MGNIQVYTICFFSVASLCTMLFVKHGDSRSPKKKDMIEIFDVED